MIALQNNEIILTGEKGEITLNVEDEVLLRFAMLYEGECEGLGATQAAGKFGYTRQRYYQLLYAFKNDGLSALKNKKTGPQTNYRRTDEAVRQIIRHRFLDPDASEEVIAQKMVQCGFSISVRSVQRVISQYGLQKKTIQLPPNKRPPDTDN
jgi:transposase